MEGAGGDANGQCDRTWKLETLTVHPNDPIVKPPDIWKRNPRSGRCSWCHRGGNGHSRIEVSRLKQGKRGVRGLWIANPTWFGTTNS